MEKNELKHWGVPGMKWGVRKKQDDTPKVDTRSDDAKKYDALKKKQISELSNDEIRWIANRMQLERSYKDAEYRERQERISRIKDALSTAGLVAENLTKVSRAVDYFQDKGSKSVTDTPASKKKKNKK